MVNLRNFSSVDERRKALEKKLGISLENIGYYSSGCETASIRNCENMVGVSQVPIGVAGPLRLRFGQAMSDVKTGADYFIPLATTEGALVASVNRGCRAVTESGGAVVFMEKVGITRGPVFKTNSLSESFKLANWLQEHFNDLNNCSQQTSTHIELKKIEPQVLGRSVFIRFYFDTDQAMGMNMVTIATDSMIRIIETKTGARCISVSGNFCVDKKPSFLNFILGRGRKVWAEAVIRKETLTEVLKISAEKIYEVWLNKCLLGSALSGSLGFNAHYANIIAAIFCATGQDLAHITEGSLGISTVETQNDDLYISVYLPDLIIGVVGGGTNLPTQKEGLEIIFGRRKADADKLAKIIAAAVLAGELSLLASLAEGSLARAHQKLARGEKPSFAKASGGRSA